MKTKPFHSDSPEMIKQCMNCIRPECTNCYAYYGSPYECKGRPSRRYKVVNEKEDKVLCEGASLKYVKELLKVSPAAVTYAVNRGSLIFGTYRVYREEIYHGSRQTGALQQG